MSSSIDHDHNEGPGEADWLTRHRDAYLGELGRLDYAASTIEPYSRAIGLFCEQVTERGLDAGEIDEAVLAELQDAVPTLRSAKGQRGRQGCIARFIAHLIDTGVIAPPTPPAPPAPGSLKHLCATYGDWLRHQQGLGQTTIKKRQAFLRRFMTFRFGAALGQLNDITPDDILSFLDARPMKTGGSGRGDPVIVRPLLAEWETAKAEVTALMERADAAGSRATHTRLRRQAEGASLAWQ